MFTNRCPSLQGIGKPPWSLWLNLCLKFNARLRDLTGGVQMCVWGTEMRYSKMTTSKIMLNTAIARINPCNLLCDL